MTIKKNFKIYSVNLLYLIFGNINEYFEEINENKYLTLVPTNKSKEKIKKYEELWIQIRDVIRSITKNLDDYYKNYLKIKFDSHDIFTLSKTIEIPIETIVVRAVFS